MLVVSCARPFGVSAMLDNDPTELPATWTSSPLTIWLASPNTSRTW
jgi:hypothetical protein